LRQYHGVLPPLPFRVLANPRAGIPALAVLPPGGFRRARAEIAAWPGYAATPLRELPHLADRLGIGALRLKDETARFGLGTAKALGACHAVAEALRTALARAGVAAAASAEELASGRHAAALRAITLCCASAGNHGRAVAWVARRFGVACTVFVPDGIAPVAAAAIAAQGAALQRISGSYDEATHAAAEAARRPGWLLVPDSSWPGMTEPPRAVMQGARVMAAEAAEQWTGAPPTHVFVQAGVGGIAAAVSVQLRAAWNPAPALVVVEPEGAACLLASAEAGELTALPGPFDTGMGPLACGTPSLLAWQELDRASAFFIALPDAAAAAAVEMLAAEALATRLAGAAGLAGLLLAAGDPAARETLGLNVTSRVLGFVTEGPPGGG